MFSNYASRWDCPFKCEAIEERSCSIETYEKFKIAQRNIRAPRKSEESFKDDPLENFKECFIMNAPHNSNMTIKAINEICLNTKQRLPFIMQAFIVKVGSGKANTKDGDNLQKLVEHLQSTTY